MEAIGRQVSKETIRLEKPVSILWRSSSAFKFGIISSTILLLIIFKAPEYVVNILVKLQWDFLWGKKGRVVKLLGTNGSLFIGIGLGVGWGERY